MYKIIENRMNIILLSVILEEELIFLFNRKTHNAVGTTHEGLHSITTEKNPIVVMKID